MARKNRQQSTQADSHLVERIRRQDQSALIELYRIYGAAVYGLALRVLHDSGLAEEITQDVFLKLWQMPERWNPALGQLSSWLLTITRNAAIDRLRKERHQQTHQLEQTDQIANTRADREHSWYDGQVLNSLLQELPTEQRQLIELAFYQGYTHSELSENLRLPLGTVKTRLRSGLIKLRTLWEKAMHPPTEQDRAP
jgi:RNA polymerase sigma-70 factor (ECF subfamily)